MADTNDEAISRMRLLTRSWNEYDDKPPSEIGLKMANEFLCVLDEVDSSLPIRIRAMAAGDIGIMIWVDNRLGHVRFYSDGTVDRLLSEVSGEADARRVQPTPDAYRATAEEIAAYVANKKRPTDPTQRSMEPAGAREPLGDER